jgi:hypothetical protein
MINGTEKCDEVQRYPPQKESSRQRMIIQDLTPIISWEHNREETCVEHPNERTA